MTCPTCTTTHHPDHPRGADVLARRPELRDVEWRGVVLARTFAESA